MRRAAWILAACLACGGGSSGPRLDPGECRTDAECDDGVACTEDVCSPSLNGVGRCDHVARADRCAPGEDCVVEGALAGCRDRTALWCAGRTDGDRCVPDDLCAEGPGTCTGGKCAYAVRSCGPRTCFGPGTCLRLTGDCAYDPLPAQAPCDTDQRTCTPEACDGAGRCVAAGAPACLCDLDADCPAPGDRCHGAPTCDRSTGTCVPRPVECPPPPDPCRVSTCDPATGGCVPGNAKDGTGCADATTCLAAGTCRGGACVQAPRDCDDGNPCTRDGCSPTAGCTHEVLDGEACDDGVACNGPDRCQAGTCLNVGPALSCPQVACRIGACEEPAGCTYSDIAPCCGNGKVEPLGGEECDPGQDTAGCVACRFAILELAPDATTVAAAWAEGQGGLVVVERAPGDAPRQVVAHPVGLDAAPGLPQVLAETPQGSPAFRPGATTLPDGTFLAAWYQEGAVQVRTVGPTPRATSLSLAGEAPGPRIAVGVSQAGGVLAFQTESMSGGRTIDSIRFATVQGSAGTLAVSKSRFATGDPALLESAILGDVCAGAAGTLVTWDRWSWNATQVHWLEAAVVTAAGDLAPTVTLKKFTLPIPMPPRCVALPAGGYEVVLASAGTDEDSPALEIWTVRLDEAGQPGEKQVLYSTAGLRNQVVDLTLPFTGAYALTGSGRLFVTPFARGLPTSTLDQATAVGLRAFHVSPAGTSTGESWKTLVPGAFVDQASAAGSPGSPALVAWYEGGVLKAFDLPPGRARARFVGWF